MKVLMMELYKLKRSKLIFIMTFLPLFAVFQGGFYIKERAQFYPGEDMWMVLYAGSMSSYTTLIYPISIAVLFALIARIEHSSNGWKMVLARPVKRESIYFSKLCIGALLVLYSLTVLSVGIVIAGLMNGLSANVPFWLIFGKIFFIFVATLPIIALQFYISINFSNVAVPLIIGGGLSLPSILVANSAKYWIYYPWTYPITTAFSDMFDAGNKMPIMYAICVLFFALLVFAGLKQFKIKDIL